MKHGKNPTRKQAVFMESNEYIPANWWVVEDTPERMVIVHRKNGRTAEIRKGKKH